MYIYGHEVLTVNLTVRICANPPVDRIIWELPTSELLKPGQSSSESSLVLHSWQTNATCVDVKLFKDAQNHHEKSSFAGAHLILAKNRLGYDETTIQVEMQDMPDPVNSATFQQTSAQCDSVHFQSFSLILMSVWTFFLYAT